MRDVEKLWLVVFQGAHFSPYLNAEQPGTAPSAAASITARVADASPHGLDADKGIGVLIHTVLPALEDWRYSFNICVSREHKRLTKPMELQLDPVIFWTALYRQPADCINSPVLGIF